MELKWWPQHPCLPSDYLRRLLDVVGRFEAATSKADYKQCSSTLRHAYWRYGFKVFERLPVLEWVLRKWRQLAQGLNLAILLGFVTLFGIQAHMVFSNIAQYQSRGLVVDNDLGQRGLALSGLFVLVVAVLALLSVRYLLRDRILGFILHAVLWFVLLLLGISTWVAFGRELGGVGFGVLLVCLAGTAYGAACAKIDARLQKQVL